MAGSAIVRRLRSEDCDIVIAERQELDIRCQGAVEPTNQWYAVAKIAGMKLCQAYRRQYGCDFISIMPTNLYGPGDNYDPASSHVAAAMQAKVYRAKVRDEGSITIWGTGKPRREF